MEWTALSPTLLSKLRTQEVYTNINVCVFVNTNQKEIDMDVHTNTLNTTFTIRGST